MNKWVRVIPGQIFPLNRWVEVACLPIEISAEIKGTDIKKCMFSGTDLVDDDDFVIRNPIFYRDC